MNLSMLNGKKSHCRTELNIFFCYSLPSKESHSLLLAARENISLKHCLEASKHEAFYRTSYEIWNQKPYSLQQLKTKKLLSQTT